MKTTKLTLLALAMATSIGFGAAAPAAELKVGDAAPDFTLKASDGKTYKLSDLKGKKAVVVAWFPAAFTSGCTAECKSVQEHSAELKKFSVAYFTASVDPLEGDRGNVAFAASLKVEFPILSDPTKATATAYGVLGIRGVANRWTYYVDINGKVSAIDKTGGTTSQGTDIIAKLKELKVPLVDQKPM